MTNEVRLMGQKEATSLGDFPALSSAMIVATLQIYGQWASENDELNMDNNSWKVKRPSDLRNEIGILSGSAAPLPFIFLIADCNSLIRSGAQLSSSADGALRRFLNCWLVSWLDCGILSLLTLVSCFNDILIFAATTHLGKSKPSKRSKP